MTESMSLKLQKDRTLLPSYSETEDRFNAISHYVGAGLSLFFFGFALSRAWISPSINKILSVLLYSIAMMLLYTMSGVYHTLKPGNIKALFRIFDHCTIFLLIAGCYSPFCLITFWDLPAGKIIFIAQWSLAITGVVLNYINVNAKPVKIFSMLSYILMGWMILWLLPEMISRLSSSCIFWLTVGGIGYTVGILFFALGKRKPFLHCVWHLFVLFGTVCQFFGIVQIL